MASMGDHSFWVLMFPVPGIPLMLNRCSDDKAVRFLLNNWDVYNRDPVNRLHGQLPTVDSRWLADLSLAALAVPLCFDLYTGHWKATGQILGNLL